MCIRDSDLTDAQLSTTQKSEDLDPLRFQQNRHQLRLLLAIRVPVGNYVLCPTSRHPFIHVTTPIDSIYIDMLYGGVALSRPRHWMMRTSQNRRRSPGLRTPLTDTGLLVHYIVCLLYTS